MRVDPRLAFGAIALFALGLLATALFLQHVERLEPCPLCILQRYGYLFVVGFALAAFVHNPDARGRVVYGALVALCALAGGAVAVRQVWLILHPEAVLACGGGGLVETLLDRFPLTHALPWLLQGNGDCVADAARLFGLPIPAWSLLCFAALLTAALLLAAHGWRGRGRRPVTG